MQSKHSLLLLSVLIAAPGAASAQAPPTPTTPPAQTAPPAPARVSDCAPMQPMQPVPPRGSIAPEGSTTGQRAEPLGDKLAKSDGVLCPPAGVDPEIRAPTPDTGNTPVIPPPGSPGGDPNVRPK
ncbi:MAG TPA: hypothetical protein VHQ48_13610 [Bradyrhizobium sp.]|nr:hypothetical protein [Bradyrhizobium sp.]